MNLYRLKEKDEVRVPRREGREKYTKLEERKMWFFFARELRAGNQDALFKRRILWKLFEQEEDTNRKMDGLESHFRKQMLKYMHRSNMSKEDMFLCLRFFRIGLNPKQQKFLEERYGCEVVCTFDGTFRRANFSFDGNKFSLPTDEELATIMADEMMEEGSLLEEMDQQPNDDGMDFFNFDNPLEEGTSRNSENSNNNNRRQNERSETPIVAENLNNNNNDDENGSSSQHSREILNNSPRIDENEQFQQIAGRQSNAEIIQLEMVSANSNNLDCSSELIGSTSSARAFQRQNEENLRIEANLNLTNQSQQSTSQQQGTIHRQMNPAKKAFINDVLKVLDGNMSTRTFIEQGGGSAVPECAEAINWLVGDENDDESIPVWRR